MRAARGGELTRHLYIVLSYPLSEPVVRNRFMPWLQTCLAALPEHCTLTLISPPNALHAAVELPAGVRHITVVGTEVQGVPFMRRAWRELQLTRRLYSALQRALRADLHQRAPVVLVSVPSMFLLFLLPKASQLGAGKGVTLALDIRDLTWEYLPSHGLTGWIKQALTFRAQQKIQQADWVSTTNQQELAYVRQLRPSETCLWVTNGIGRAQFETLRNVAAASGSLERRTHVLYLGNIGVAEHLSSLLEAAALRPEMDFSLVGSGGDVQRLRHIVSEQGLTNVEMPGRCHWEDVQGYYQRADILFAQVHPDHQQQMPSKLYEYLATGRPIVFAGNGYAVQVVQQFSGVFTCPPLNAEAISTALMQAQAYLTEQTSQQLEAARSLNLKRLENDYIREGAIEQWLERVL